MKNYDEMANDVFRKIDEYNVDKRRKRKRITRVSVSAACVCLAAIVGIGAWHVFKPQPKSANDALYPGIKDWYGPGENESSSGTNVRADAPIAEPFIYLCSYEADSTVKSDLIQPQQAYKCKIYLEFVSIKGLSEKEINRKFNECHQKCAEKICNKECTNQICVIREKDCIFTRVSENFLRLKLDDVENVKQIRVTNVSEHGEIDAYGTKGNLSKQFPHGKDITIEKDDITDDLAFSWSFYGDVDSYLKKNPTPNYSDFNDTFNFTVEYNDGTKETASVDIVFDESGAATMICNGYKTII